MSDRRGQVFKAILTTFLFPISSCFGAIYYVNINNPAPGTGGSWATSFNNLQSALAVASTFDQIWIAQGTYKPSSPAGRSATFAIPGGTTIYGGFNGTETANTQANPALYPTILSGDIGIAGNSSDNCYHVVTYNANLWIGSLHGVTIRDGRADAGSSSVAQPDNTGGGVAFLSANPGEASGTDFYNCTFTNNYAFYGGAIGSYGISALQVNYGAMNCLFHDNQAVYGGAVYNTIAATDYLYVFEDDIFYNNTASSGGASVFGNAVTNGTPTEYLRLENCLFYNEAAPIFTNDFTNSAFSNIQLNYNIVWTSGTPYTSAYSGGNKPLAMSNSDIDGTFPLGSNIDADPLFVNAAGYDFHVSPCSPVIDKGPSFAPTTTDFGGNARMQGAAVDIGPYETPKGTAAVAPIVNTPIGICLNSAPSDLSGDATGTGLLWYTSATGGTGSSTAPTPVTTATGTTRYYVTQTPAGSCESSRQEIDVTVNPLPANPTYPVPPSYCINAPASALSANGTSLLWYTSATTGSGNPTAPTPSTATAGTNTYYVSQTVGGCESQRTPISVTVRSASPAPTPNTVPQYCMNAPASALSANGAGLLWYTTATGGSGSPTAPNPGTAIAGTTAYYVTQTPAGSCESSRLEIDVTVKPLPANPTFPAPPSYCISAPASALSANGTSLLWYTTAAGGSGNPTAPTPSTATAGTNTYYVSQTVGGCESQRTPIPVTVMPPPAAPAAATQSFCENAMATPMTATGTGLLWYATPTGGTGDPIAPTPNTTSPGTTTWYVSQTIGCESGRTPVTATVNANPKVSIDPVNGSVCAGGTIKLQANGAESYQWSPSTGLSDPSVSDPVATMKSDIIYTVTGTTDHCSAAAQVALTVGTDCLGYYIPNAFSPNGSGANEIFRVKTGDVPRSFSMIVFNRYGGKVFESSNIGVGWNGTIGSNLAPAGTYVYTVVLTSSTGVVIRRQGTLILVR